MHTRFTLAFLVVAMAMIAMDNSWNIATTNPTGAPGGVTGNPSDNGGKSCAQSACHGGASANPVAGWITWDGPTDNKYVPGNTYNITCTATEAGLVRFGFEASAFNLSGSALGTVAITNSTETQMISFGGKSYITHKQAGTSGTNTKSWTFSWTAPASGGGTAAIYAAFNCANNDNTRLGDKIYTSVLVLQEGTSSIGEISDGREIDLRFFPQPVRDQFTISFEMDRGDRVNAEVFDISGRKKGILFDGEVSPGKQSYTIVPESLGLPAGIYLVKLTVGDTPYVQRILVL